MDEDSKKAHTKTDKSVCCTKALKKYEEKRPGKKMRDQQKKRRLPNLLVKPNAAEKPSTNLFGYFIQVFEAPKAVKGLLDQLLAAEPSAPR